MSTSPSWLAELQSLLGEKQVRTDADSLMEYGRDWTRLYQPAPSAVVFPGSVEQVQQLVVLANRHDMAIVPSGGRTGLSGAAVAKNGEWVVSMDRMNRILDFNAMDRSVTCQAGVITETIQQYAADKGLLYPVDFAASGSSHIGGNIATNAGGIQVIRYGLTRNWVSGLKVVTGRGELLELNNGLIKNASGYDLRHLFIGSEGTLGIIVEATLQLTSPPREPSVMVLGVTELEGVMAVFDTFRSRLSLIAFEFFTELALKHVLEKGLQRPFDSETPDYVRVEFEQLTENDMDRALEAFEYCMEQGWVEDGVASQSEGQAESLWRLREDITESIAHYLPYKNDISVRVSRVPDFLQAIDSLFAEEYPDFEVIWFGHIGDGNLHISVLKPEAMDHGRFVERCQEVTHHLFETIRKHGGSISAEHGVGLTKKPYLSYTRSAEEIAVMQALKTIFDPGGIMNPGKVFG